MNVYKSAGLLSLFVLISGTATFTADNKQNLNDTSSPGAPGRTQLPPLNLKAANLKKKGQLKSLNHHSTERSHSPLAMAAASTQNGCSQVGILGAPAQRFRKRFGYLAPVDPDGNPLPEIKK